MNHNEGVTEPDGEPALTFILPSGCGVEAVQFSYNGFSWHSDVYHVGQWNFTFNDSSIFLKPSSNGTAVAGRFLYPQRVQMKDPQTRTATSFNCSFIFQILVQDGNGGRTGSGLTFMMVPDTSTVGAPEGYMGLLSSNTSENAHTFGVEFDTHMNPEFDDPNGNHIGIDLASVNSTATFTPQYRLAQNRSDVYHQVWIEYSQTLDIYIAEYDHGKPAKPFSTSVNLSLLNEYMYIGFSAAVEEDVNNLHKLCAWSFSTDGPAPPISIVRGAPNSSDSGHEPGAAAPAAATGVVRMIGIIFGIIGAICIVIAILCWSKTLSPSSNTDQPIRFYLAHAGGEKNFTEQLYRDLTFTWSYKLNRIKVFFDRHSIPWGEDFTENIKRELNRTQVGVVIVTREFFERPWPMTELVYLVRSKRSNDNGVRILPLFYRLTVGEVRCLLRAGAWDAMWSEMASPRHRHPLDAEECRAAVETLCNQQGVSYVYAEQDNDARYRQDVLYAVAEICKQMKEQRSSRNFED